MTQCITESLNSLNSQPSRLLFPYGQRTSFRASERDVSLLTNRTAPTRYESVGCDERNFSSSEELRLVAPSAEAQQRSC